MTGNNKDISIDVEISADGQQKLDQYKTAFDGLRASISNLSDPINKLNGDISKLTESVNQFNSGNESVGDSISKVKSIYEGLSGILKGLKIAFDSVKGGALSFEAALTGGLSIVIAFLPEIIKFTKELFTGKEAVSAMAINFKNLNDVMKESNKEAASQIIRLDLLYKSATNVNNSYADRLKSVKELKKEFPEHLKGIRDEDILNGKAYKTYKELTKSIVENARAKAALAKLTEAENKMLDADYQIEKIKNANENEIRVAKDNFAKQATPYRGGRSDSNLRIEINDSNDRAQKAIKDQQQLKTIYQDNINFLTKFAGGANAIAQSINAINSSNDEKPVRVKAHVSVSKLKDTSDKLNKKIELHQEYYQTELTNFKQQLADKQISQTEYDEASKQLQEKYYSGVRDTIKQFNDQDLQQAMQHQQELIEAQKLGEDQHAINKAFLPADKLATEKKMITDKYDFEIQKAAEAGKDTSAIREQYQQEMVAADKKYTQERKDLELQAAQQVSNAAFS